MAPRSATFRGPAKTFCGGSDMSDLTCIIDGCEKPRQRYRPMCRMHRARQERHGDPSICFNPHRPVAERFHGGYEKADNGCWLWRHPSENGYGRIRVNRKTMWAHRIGYELLVGPIPPELELDHLCRVPACVNPAHLEPVTHRENLRRGARHRPAHPRV